MDVELSDAYQPLFELLHCWDIVKSPTFTKDYTEEEQEYWLSLKGVDTVIMKGGRDSSKTFSESVWIPVAVKDFGHRVLYTRYAMNTTDQSISEALNERISLLNIEESFEFAKNTYQCTENDGKIFITGIKTSSLNQTAKLKSLENFSIFVTDEAEEVKTFEEWDKIRKSIRAKDVQCISLLVFNPPTHEHWLHTEFFEDLNVDEGFCGVKDNILYIHTTYLDNIDHIAEHNLREYEKLKLAYDTYEPMPMSERENAPGKLKKDWSKYKHIVLGGFKNVAEGVIYEDWEIGDFDDSLIYCYGLDFGFNDPDALTKVAIDHKQMRIYVKELYFKNNTGSDALAQILMSIVGRSDLIIADAAQKRLINDLYHKGLNIRRCSKGGGSVQRGIKTIQGYTIIVDPNSPNIKKSLNNYCWHDSRSGVPKHDWSDLMDSIRYAALDLIRY